MELDPVALKAPRCITQVKPPLTLRRCNPAIHANNQSGYYATDLALTTTRGAQPSLMDGSYLAAAGRE